MTDSFPADAIGEGTDALSYPRARSDPAPDTSEYADQYNLNDIGLASRVLHSTAI